LFLTDVVQNHFHQVVWTDNQAIERNAGFFLAFPSERRLYR
jgi:hypothetical protein